ncbi:hypothetical protein C5S42_11765 [Candidatus Methanomarinus sp.]|nr:hypothetical protein C5S42_11765 [ANME-2 cluster archaeon]
MKFNQNSLYYLTLKDKHIDYKMDEMPGGIDV